MALFTNCKLKKSLSVANLINKFTIVIYNSRVIPDWEFILSKTT